MAMMVQALSTRPAGWNDSYRYAATPLRFTYSSITALAINALGVLPQNAPFLVYLLVTSEAGDTPGSYHHDEIGMGWAESGGRKGTVMRRCRSRSGEEGVLV